MSALLFAYMMAPLSGCDFIYGILQKEGAEEKKLLGDIPPFQYNPKVEKVQQVLADYGYGPGTPDGKFGVNTRRAIERFQEDQGLKISRFLDKATWQRITAIKKTGLVKNGLVQTRAVQEALHNAGYDPGVIDGRMGPRTESALKTFQKEHGLKPDGIIGQKTLRLLVKYLINRP